MGHGFAGRVQTLWLRLNHEARQCRPVFLELGDDIEGSVSKDERGLIPGLAVPLDNVEHPGTVDGHESANPAKHGQQRIARGGLELKLVVLDDLGTEEGAAKHHEGCDQNYAGNVCTLSKTIGIEAVHASSR